MLKEQENEIKEKNNNPFKKFFNKITGKSKQYTLKQESINYMKEKVEQRMQNVITESKNYSIHEMLAEIEIFLEDNKEVVGIEKELIELNKLKENLGKVYRIDDLKVNKIIKDRTEENLPTTNKKVTPEQQVKIEENKFLKHNGYEEKENNKNKMSPITYNDEELASKISVINSYININIKNNRFKTIEMEDTLDMVY